MKILIINNRTSYLNSLLNLLKEQEVRVVNFNSITQEDVENYDAVILSGGHPYSVLYDHDKFQREIELIKNTDKPLIGICLGCELIAYTFGSELLRLPHKERGIIDIKIVHQEEIFENMSNIRVFEHHRWAIKKLPNELVGLARSKDGWEVIKHRSKKIYGVQFHPEVEQLNAGFVIFQNILNQI